jgi:coenzyme F420 hydrogenase subunit beta
VIGIPCQVHALRALEEQLGFKRLYVIGTPCSDNTTTERFHEFLELVAKDIDAEASSITYLAFRADYRVELRLRNGTKKLIPFLQLPISKLPPDFFALTCRTCVDYTNVLADITVGYMGGEGEQWLLVRNERGSELLPLLGDEVVTRTPGSAGKRHGAVAGCLKNVQLETVVHLRREMPRRMKNMVPIHIWPLVAPCGLKPQDDEQP